MQMGKAEDEALSAEFQRFLEARLFERSLPKSSGRPLLSMPGVKVIASTPTYPCIECAIKAAWQHP